MLARSAGESSSIAREQRIDACRVEIVVPDAGREVRRAIARTRIFPIDHQECIPRIHEVPVMKVVMTGCEARRRRKLRTMPGKAAAKYRNICCRRN